MIARLRAAVIAWIERTFIAPAVERVISNVGAGVTYENGLLRKCITDQARRMQDSLPLMNAEILETREAVRRLNLALFARTPDPEQIAELSARVATLDDRIAHLSALMFGKTIAENVTASRGPREFTHEDRQCHA